MWEERGTAGSCCALASSLLSQDCVHGRKSGRCTLQVLYDPVRVVGWAWSLQQQRRLETDGAKTQNWVWRDVKLSKPVVFRGRVDLISHLSSLLPSQSQNFFVPSQIIHVLAWNYPLLFSSSHLCFQSFSICIQSSPTRVGAERSFCISSNFICNPFHKIPPYSTPFLLLPSLPSVTHCILSEQLMQWQTTY